MENQEQQVEQQPQPELGIADLQNIRTLLQVAVRRGTFAAGELTSVGAVYDRLNTFLDAVAPPPPQPEGEQQQEQPAAQ